MLSRNGHRGGRNIGNKHGALLKGLVRCATCDVGMIHTYVEKKNRVYRYYVCIKAHQRGWTQCETRCVSAPALESAVLEQLRGVGSNPAVLRSVLQKINEHQPLEANEDARPANPKEVEAALHAFDPLWEQLSTWEQERFIRALVDQVRYDGKTGTVTLGFRSSGIKDLCSWAPVITEKYDHV
jgi:hypothetical protein